VPVPAVDAIGRPRSARYLRSGDLAVLELAEICGLAGLAEPDPLHAHTLGLGIVLAAAARSGARRVLVGLGGSASTDAGTGALSALGIRLIGVGGRLPIGGAGLAGLSRADVRLRCPLPPDGVEVLVDVDAPLFGPSGAAAAFAPQKGADGAQVAELDRGLRRVAEVLGSDPDQPGAGAAGGTGYGLAWWGARLVPGAARVAELIGLQPALLTADLVITGEGRFDAGSRTGKACGYVLDEATRAGRPAVLLAGSMGDRSGPDSDAAVIALDWLAGSAEAAMAQPARWLAEAARQAALAR
jgi:glycerate kinase